MRRDGLVTVALPGDFGNPRSAVVIQSDQFLETGSVTVLLLAGTLVDAPPIRSPLLPAPYNGLIKPSQVQVDKAMSVKRDRIGRVIGRLDDEAMLTVTRSLALFLGLG